MNQLKSLKLTQIKPLGWLYNQLQEDVLHGFVGHLDALVPDLIVEDDIYGKDRLSKKVKSKDVGAIAQDQDWEVQYLWWNSETQSNWYDGLIRHAYLVQDAATIKRVEAYVERIISTQDADGYLGIYDQELRYNFDSENGELWAQATLLRSLIAVQEATTSEGILDVIQRAVMTTMQAYPIHHSTPFKAKDSYAGLCHGLCFVDVLEWLYEQTNDTQYIEYAVWLYEDYSNHELSESDIQVNNLLDKNKLFNGHSVHTYEHLRALLIAAYYDQNPTYSQALQNYQKKLSKCICPSGAPIGDEWIYEHIADPSMHGYEYCSLHELLHSYVSYIKKTKNMVYADAVEQLLLNAAQGARSQDNASIAYLKSDNSYAMEGHFQFHQDWIDTKQTRYRYSPTHQDAAVCCVPNAGRIYPYYIQHMWMYDNMTLYALLYGPNQMTWELDGTQITITTDTKYPYDDQITFHIKVDKPISFMLGLRIPTWWESYHINMESYQQEQIAYIKKTWNDANTIQLTFKNKLQVKQDLQSDTYLMYGPFVMAYPMQAYKRITKPLQSPFYESEYEAIEDDYKHLKWINDTVWKVTSFDSASCKVQVELWDDKKQRNKCVELIPMGQTTLRKVTFEVK